MNRSTSNKSDENKTELAILGVVLIILGVLTFVLNYERQTIEIPTEASKKHILEYHAPTWDPLPHYVEISTSTQRPIIVSANFIEDPNKSKIFQMTSGVEKVTVFPGETLRISMENPNYSSGTVKTVLWCDSWNYGAAALALTGALSIFLNKLRKEY